MYNDWKREVKLNEHPGRKKIRFSKPLFVSMKETVLNTISVTNLRMLYLETGEQIYKLTETLRWKLFPVRLPGHYFYYVGFQYKNALSDFFYYLNMHTLQMIHCN